MPILKDARRLITVDLKKLDGGQVVIRECFLTGEIEMINKRGGVDDLNSGRLVSYPLTFLIKSWNLTDENGGPLPITEENIGLLDVDDINVIYKALDSKDDIDFLAPGGNTTQIS